MTCFARQGYHATSMDDVVRESGMSVGAIYSYFASKEDLFLALAEARSQQTLAYHERAVPQSRAASAPSPPRRWITSSACCRTTSLLPMVRVGVEFLSEAIKSERIQERQDHRCETIRQFYHWLLNDARQSHEIREDVDVEAATELLMALNEGILLLSVAGMRRVPLERLQAAYTALLDNGLASPTGSMFAPSTSPSTSTAAANGHHTGGSQP